MESKFGKATGSFDEQLLSMNCMLKKGNSAFCDRNPHDALTRYKIVVSVFRLLKITNREWKSHGSNNQFITEVEYECKSNEERHELV